jgi:hypothetical protein
VEGGRIVEKKGCFQQEKNLAVVPTARGGGSVYREVRMVKAVRRRRCMYSFSLLPFLLFSLPLRFLLNSLFTFHKYALFSSQISLQLNRQLKTKTIKKATTKKNKKQILNQDIALNFLLFILSLISLFLSLFKTKPNPLKLSSIFYTFLFFSFDNFFVISLLFYIIHPTKF